MKKGSAVQDMMCFFSGEAGKCVSKYGGEVAKCVNCVCFRYIFGVSHLFVPSLGELRLLLSYGLTEEYFSDSLSFAISEAIRAISLCQLMKQNILLLDGIVDFPIFFKGMAEVCYLVAMNDMTNILDCFEVFEKELTEVEGDEELDYDRSTIFKKLYRPLENSDRISRLLEGFDNKSVLKIPSLLDDLCKLLEKERFDFLTILKTCFSPENISSDKEEYIVIRGVGDEVRIPLFFFSSDFVLQSLLSKRVKFQNFSPFTKSDEDIESLPDLCFHRQALFEFCFPIAEEAPKIAKKNWSLIEKFFASLPTNKEWTGLVNFEFLELLFFFFLSNIIDEKKKDIRKIEFFRTMCVNAFVCFITKFPIEIVEKSLLFNLLTYAYVVISKEFTNPSGEIFVPSFANFEALIKIPILMERFCFTDNEGVICRTHNPKSIFSVIIVDIETLQKTLFPTHKLEFEKFSKRKNDLYNVCLNSIPENGFDGCKHCHFNFIKFASAGVAISKFKNVIEVCQNVIENNVGFEPFRFLIVSAFLSNEQALTKSSMELFFKNHPTVFKQWFPVFKNLFSLKKEPNILRFNCGHCNVFGFGRLKHCACGFESYCNVECQKKDWAKHKLTCNWKKTKKK